MTIDLTTKIDKELMEQWLTSQENRHIATGLPCRVIANIKF